MSATMEYATTAHGEYEHLRHRPGSTLVIRVEPETKLLGPHGGHYLPCSICRRVHEIPLNVVSYLCTTCDVHDGVFTVTE